MMHPLVAEDGHSFDCWIEPARGTRRGGLVILQEIFGVTDQLKGVATRYAALGYEVAIPALFDRQQRGAVLSFDRPEAGRALMQAADPELVLRDIAAAAACLAANGGGVGVMGFCWGGGLALRAAQTLDISAGISFYGTRLTNYLDRPLKAPMQGHFGRRDDHVPPEMLAATQDYLPEMEMYLYEAGHGFANEARPAGYAADAAELAHRRSADFLAAHIG